MKKNVRFGLLLFSLLGFTAIESKSNPECILENTITINSDGTTTIPQDKTIRKGVLPNGITYYIHHTDVVKDKASYYIMQNVGSVLENDDQQGLAHFLEHMAFNGTKTYPGKKFLNTMQENGLVFGRDINAYTSFDETVYNINNVPTTPEMTGHGLQILHDWANELLLTEEEIDAERGVIKEEWRQRQNGRMRIFEQTSDAVFGSPKYSKRFPIGLMDIVENFDYKVLRDFYHDWYRTDLQAIAIIGDVDMDDMEAKIKEKFSSIPAVKKPRERFEIVIPDNAEMQYALGMDKEVNMESIAFSIRHKKHTDNGTKESLDKSLSTYMVTGILNERLQAISQNPDSPFLRAQMGYQGVVRKHDAFSVNIMPKANKQEEAFTLVMNELHRALKFGFTKAEIARQETGLVSYYDNYIKELGNRSHQNIISTFVNNYLEGTAMNDPVQEFEVAKTVLESMTAEKLQTLLQSFYTSQNRSVVITGVEGRNNLDKAKVQAIITAAENNTSLQPYAEEDTSKSLMEGVDLTAGSIVDTKVNDAIGYTEYTLSNGIKVYYKFVDKDKNAIELVASSEGGETLVDPKDYFNASLASGLAGQSGINEFSAIELQKKLTGKKVRVSSSIGTFNEYVYGSSTPQDIETLMQLTNLQFTKPRFDQKMFGVLKQNIENALLRSKGNLQAQMQDSVTVNVYGNHPAKQILSTKQIESADFNTIKQIYLERFKNPADFKFFVIGDIKEETLKPLLEKYIASLPTIKEMESWDKTYSVNWVKNHIDKDIYLKMENPKGTVRIVNKKETSKVSLKDRYVADVLASILQLRYTETLRESEGGTYGAQVRRIYEEKPVPAYGLSISFDCNPDMVEKLIGIVHEELEKIAKGQINTADFDKTIKAKLKDRIERKESNAYDSNMIQTYVLKGYNLDDKKNFEDIIKGITHKDIQEMVKTLNSKDAKSYEIVFKPKK